MPTVFSLTNNNDVFVGTNGGDIISGRDGSDEINGGNGNDLIYGHSAAAISPGAGDIIATQIAATLERPVFATAAPGRPNELFVVESHTGKINILDLTTNTVSATPFLDLPEAELSLGGEEGLLGLAFHPDYASNGKFYVFHNTAAGNIVVEEFLRSDANPDVADLSSKKQVIELPHPTFENHNGGWIGFGPDGMLYVAVGDGGGGGDPSNNAQNVDSLLGKMLRIDVNSDAFADDAARNYAIPSSNPFASTAGADEIWALGLRNPWRSSFDRSTGDLYIADVGQGLREEINFQLANAAGGTNYGWKVKEGNLVFDDTTPGNPSAGSSALTAPIHEYNHESTANGGFSVTGGYVYRGQSPGLQGQYFFTDFVTNQIWTFKVENGVATQFSNRTAQIVSAAGPITNIASFAEDAQGNLYAVTLDGSLFGLDPGAASGDGNDTLYGGNGADRIHGDFGNDRLFGEQGDDRLFGGAGNDVIEGGSGRDRLYGEEGFDELLGGSGRDRLSGGDGDDLLRGGLGDDRSYGGNGNDQLFGDSGNDQQYGEAGDDVLFSGAGGDRMDGGSGIDTADYSAEALGAVINLARQSRNSGVARGDRLEDIERISGSDTGADRITGDSRANTLLGNGGDDRLSGGRGNDTLRGGAGSDWLDGGAHGDTFQFASLDELGDTIVNFETIDDFQFSRAAFGNLTGTNVDVSQFLSVTSGNAATDGNHRFVFDEATKQLWYDSDGTGAVASVLVAKIENGVLVTHSDLLLI